MRLRYVLALIMLGGCTVWPLQEADCRNVNWRSRGYADGFGGHPRQDLRLVPECRERYHVQVNDAEYLAGWAEGHNEWDRLIGSRQKAAR